MRKYEQAKNHGQRNYPLFLLCSLLVALVVVAIPPVVASSMHEPDKVRLSVNGPRPVALAAEMLEKSYGWIVTYEDPPFTHDSDLLVVTETVRRDLDKFKPGEAPKVFVPRGGKLALDFDVEPATQRPAAADLVIQQLLDTYNVDGPGTFRLERNGQRLHIIGASAKNKDGVWTAHQSVLDALITIPPQKRTGMMLLQAFCAAVSEASHTPVFVGMVPLNFFARYETEAGANNQNARDFLLTQLDQVTGRARLSWQLLYDSNRKTYLMNIHSV
jgi:hypothetical protein